MSTVLIVILCFLWAILIACDIIFGRLLKLYDKTKWFDLILHTYGGALTALTAFFIIGGLTDLSLPLSMFFAFCVSMTASVVLEFIEFAIDRVFKTNGQRWKDGYNAGLIDTMTDLLVAAAGALSACLILLAVF